MRNPSIKSIVLLVMIFTFSIEYITNMPIISASNIFKMKTCHSLKLSCVVGNFDTAA
jgi:hypothetical protein